MQWYRKDVLAKAGIDEPATTWVDMLAQCDKLAAAGIQPWAYGDRDGYTTSNMMTTEITSYFQPGDVQKVLAGDIKYTDQKFLDALTARSTTQDPQVRPGRCVDPRADRCRQRPGHRQGRLHGGLPRVPALLRLGQGQDRRRPDPLLRHRPAVVEELVVLSSDNWVIPRRPHIPTWPGRSSSLRRTRRRRPRRSALLGRAAANKAAAAADHRSRSRRPSATPC